MGTKENDIETTLATHFEEARKILKLSFEANTQLFGRWEIGSEIIYFFDLLFVSGGKAAPTGAYLIFIIAAVFTEKREIKMFQTGCGTYF